jgi:S1-C subfamily serine protease
MSQSTSALADLSDALAAAVEKAGASTVLVNARRRFPASGIIWSADGVIVTSDHVIERDDDITITLADGRELKATIAGRDPGSDIAVLKVGATGGPWRTFRGTQVDGYIRTDTTFYPGFSGGPLVDSNGRVAGMNSSRLGRGAGMTVPIAAVAKVVGDLLKGGRVRRAYLGLSSQTARLPQSMASQLGGQETGLLVVMVEPGSPAEAGGLFIGDILVKLAGSKVEDTDALQALLGADRVDQPTPVTVFRGGELKELTVTIGERK